MTWTADRFPPMRAEAHFGDRVVSCFAERPADFHALFAETAARAPGAEALVEIGPGSGGRRLSWAEAVQATAMEAAQTIAGYARQTARMAREAVARAEDSPLSEGLLFERRAFQALFARPEREEGTNAFMAKRKPQFH
ncbi:enoyl-CoA hydratase-related protein [Roseivivax sp. CAU 1761]